MTKQKNNKLKKMSLFLVLVMICNFLITPISTTVNALTNDTLTNYVVSLDTKVDNVLEKIENEKSNVENDKAHIKALEKMNDEFSLLLQEYDKKKVEMSIISLLTFIENSNDAELLNRYQEYVELGNALPTIDTSNIYDITYVKDSNEIVLLSADDICNLIINYYLSDLSNSVNDYINNYDLMLNNLVDTYNIYEDKIDDLITKIDDAVNYITSYEISEKELNNNPNLLIDGESIYDKFNTLKNDLGLLKENISFDDFDTLYNNYLKLYNDYYYTFKNNNLNYQDLGLDYEISALESEYKNLDLSIESYVSDKTIDEIVDNLNLGLINNLKDALDLDESYFALKDKINTYLERKASDTSVLNDLMLNLDGYYEKYNENDILEFVRVLIEKTDKTDEDKVSLLYNFLDFPISDELKGIIINAKLAFYKLSLKDNSKYDISLSSEYLVISNLKESLLVDDFINNLLFNGRLELINDGDSIIISNQKLVLYDSNDKKIITYNIIIKGDMNGDGLFSLDDVNILKDLVISENVKKEDILRGDLDNNSGVDLKDVVILKDYFNSEDDNFATDASIKLERYEEGNKVYYKVLLEADGLVKAIEFNFGVSSDLEFLSLTSDYNVSINDKNNKLVGVDNFENRVIATLIYEKNDEILDETTIVISNITLALDNSYATIERVLNVLSNAQDNNNDTDTDASENYNVIRTSSDVVYDDTKVDNNSDDNKDIKDTTDTKDIKDEKESKILWYNVVKIVVIILLGILIIYFLNKSEEEENRRKESEIRKE